ncbi:fimbrial protein [Enterobacter sp.]|uniref:fimbrial protein n=1 Tax=Enterobacter sp. TaxID=42895 RepID=UPI00296FD4F0|nr:fimbrial protein [Enterobacter sp.]
MPRLHAKLLAFSWFLASLLSPATSQATTVLHNCFDAPETYSIQHTQALSPQGDITGSEIISEPSHLVGESTFMVANCDCPGNLYDTTPIYELTAAGSPLPPGHAPGFGYLTENLDIEVAGYTDAIFSPSGDGLTKLVITDYPSTMDTLSARVQNWNFTEAESSICRSGTGPAPAPGPAKRQFKWNVIAATFYIKKPILGEETFPPTLVIQNYACLYFGSGSCNKTEAEHVSDIWLSGTLSAPLSCTINAGNTIEVELGQIASTQFVTPGAPPAGYALKDVDISYHCDNPASSNSQKIKMTFTADLGVSEGSQGLVAKLVDRDDLGVRLYDEGGGNVRLDGTAEFPVTLDEQGNGQVKMKAAPVSTTVRRPAPGSFDGNVTVRMDIR